MKNKNKVEDLEKEKNNSLQLLEDQKKLLEQKERNKGFSQTYISYDESGVVKPTFVSELYQEVNIFFTI